MTYCGAFPSSPHSFAARLSPQCADLFSRHRSSWSELGLSNLVTHSSTRPCSLRATTRPRNPVVVSSNSTATFVICTAPKAGCTNLRKLIHAIISEPVQRSTDALGQFIGVHFAAYPTVWHYDLEAPRANSSDSAASAPSSESAASTSPARSLSAQPFSTRARQQLLSAVWQPPATLPDTDAALKAHRAAARRSSATIARSTSMMHNARVSAAPRTAAPPPRVPASIPSFIVGRNPYVRILSGFLDKMIANPDRTDDYTRGHVNAHLRLPRGTRWRATPASFHAFVRTLALYGVSAVDAHFRPTVSACSETFLFDYYLRLEDLQEWLPCWMHGLGLRAWLEQGWANTPHGAMYVGAGDHFITLKSHSVKRGRRPRWNAARGTATRGAEDVDWAWVSGDRCWWKPEGMTCAEYFDSFTAENGAVVPGPSMEVKGAGEGGGEGGGTAHDQHDTSAQRRWQTYYTQEIADLVYFMYSRDFEAFGYPRHVVAER